MIKDFWKNFKIWFILKKKFPKGAMAKFGNFRQNFFFQNQTKFLNFFQKSTCLWIYLAYSRDRWPPSEDASLLQRPLVSPRGCWPSPEAVVLPQRRLVSPWGRWSPQEAIGFPQRLLASSRGHWPSQRLLTSPGWHCLPMCCVRFCTFAIWLNLKVHI